MFVILMSTILSLISGYFEGLMELAAHSKLGSEKDPEHTQFNKWKVYTVKGVKTKTAIKKYNKPWYYLFFKSPEFEEAFPFSSSLLVGFTDPWHKFKMLSSGFMVVSLVVAYSLPIVFNLSFCYLHLIPFSFWGSKKLGWWVSYSLNLFVKTV